MLKGLGNYGWVVEFVQKYLHTLTSFWRDTQSFGRWSLGMIPNCQREEVEPKLERVLKGKGRRINLKSNCTLAKVLVFAPQG